MSIKTDLRAVAGWEVRKSIACKTHSPLLSSFFLFEGWKILHYQHHSVLIIPTGWVNAWELNEEERRRLDLCTEVWGRRGTHTRVTLLCSLGPFQVIWSGLLSCQALDDVLQSPPEANLLQGVVQPACIYTWTHKQRHRHTETHTNNSISYSVQTLESYNQTL